MYFRSRQHVCSKINKQGDKLVLDFISDVKPFLEVLYFIAGIVVACSAIFALKQISILKRTLQVQSKRDALKITSEQCEIYFNQIIKQQNEFHDQIKKHDVKYFEGWDIKTKNNSISISRKSKPSMKGFEDIVDSLSVLNSMESFSSFFISKVADETVAYNTIGTNFLNFSRELMPWVLGCREDGHFQNLTKLFILWETRRLHFELLNEKRDLEKKLQNTSFETTTPLGAENT